MEKNDSENMNDRADGKTDSEHKAATDGRSDTRKDVVGGVTTAPVSSSSSQQQQSAGQYAYAVNCWMQQCYYWHLMAANFPYFAMQQMLGQQQQHRFQQPTTAAAAPPVPPPPPANYFQRLASRIHSSVLYRMERVRMAQRFGNLQVNPALIRLTELRGRQYRIPSAWKRFSAELVDFAILFLLKLFITFIAMDFFDMIDLENRYDENYFKDGFQFNFTLQLTQDIFILELIHRVVVCFFEALCLHQGTNGTGGATPGKSLLGLRVVTCESIQLLQDNSVLVYPAGDIGLGWALLRSVVKNFTMALLFPACITMFFFPFQRTVYDILCGCLVVEDIRPRPVQ